MSNRQGNTSDAGSLGPSNLPSDVEQDHPHTAPSYLSTHNTNIRNTYTPQHQLATGRPSIFSHAVSIRQKPGQSQDIVPEISPYEGYKHEFKRLETFNAWPLSSNVRKEDLARNGFIYLDVADRVQCVFCRGILSSWEPGDIVENEHKKHCPECAFAFGYNTGNIPLSVAPAPTPTPHPGIVTSQTQHQPLPNHIVPNPQPAFYNTEVKFPVQNAMGNTPQQTVNIMPANAINIGPGTSATLTGNYPNRHGNFSLASNTPDTKRILDESTPSMSSLPSLPSGQQSMASRQPVPTNEPKYANWGDEHVRLRSFTNWPSQMTQTPQDLVRAGMLYMGEGDRCKCYWCGGELYDWEPTDEPMEEHAKWFPHCNYVRNLKGNQYMQYVRDKQNGVAEPSLSTNLSSNPHVLAVMQNGYTQEQVQEVFNRFGSIRFVDAPTIVRAIEETKAERQAMMHRNNGLQHFGTQDTGRSGSDEVPMDEDDDIHVTTPKCDEASNDKSFSSGSRPGSATSNKGGKDSPSTVKDVDSVLLENEKLKDQKLCKICLDNELSMTFIPCGHLATCEECSKALTECPICRKPIKDKVKIFWS